LFFISLIIILVIEQYSSEQHTYRSMVFRCFVLRKHDKRANDLNVAVILIDHLYFTNKSSIENKVNT